MQIPRQYKYAIVMTFRCKCSESEDKKHKIIISRRMRRKEGGSQISFFQACKGQRFDNCDFTRSSACRGERLLHFSCLR